MDYTDHIDNSDEDHSYDMENDEYDDEELYELAVVGAFSGRIGLPPAVMGWAASCGDGP